MAWPAIGELLEGRYRLDALLGEGGQATVFSASDVGSGRPVAIKVLKRDGDRYPPPSRVASRARASA